MSIFNILTLLGGLAMFLYGMGVMGESLEKRAGSSLNSILQKLTDNKYKGFLLGIVVTAIIQSSSATTVMVIGFVNSGIMQLGQAIGIIMGANVGTTVTAWLLSMTGIEGDSLMMQLLKPTSFSPLLAFIGILLILFAKSSAKKETGNILLGFAILMFGMETMSGAVKPLADVPEFANLLLIFSNPLFGVLAGAVITGIIQSSSASVGILQALSATGKVTYATAIPIVLGQNIGTCVTALLSSIGANKNAKRAAFVHLYFNIIGTFLFLAVFYILHAVFQFAFVDTQANALGIAVVHTVFNLSATLVLLPFCEFLEKLACMTVKDEPDEVEEEFKKLDERLLATPTVAISQCQMLSDEMASMSKKALFLSVDMLMGGYSSETAKKISRLEEKVDLYDDKLSSYMLEISRRSLSQSDSRELSKLLHSIGEFERISDHAMNIVESAKEIKDKNITFSQKALCELNTIANAVKEIVELASDAFEKDDLKSAKQVEPLEQVVDYLRNALKSRHIIRLQAGSCSIEMGFVYLELLTNFERVADHCSNLAAYVLELHNGSLETHEYLQRLKSNPDVEYREYYEGFRAKYAYGLSNEETDSKNGSSSKEKPSSKAETGPTLATENE